MQCSFFALLQLGIGWVMDWVLGQSVVVRFECDGKDK